MPSDCGKTHAQLRQRYLGSLLSELGRLDEAAEVLQKANELQPDPAGFNSLGTCLHRAGRIGEGEASFRRAVDLKPDFVEALSNLALNVAQQGRREEAVALARMALRINPNFAPAVATLFFEQRHLCDWQDFEVSEHKLRDLVRAGERISPFSFITANTPPDEQLICARNWAASLLPACAVTRRRFPVGASPPGELAPAGSNRSSHGGNEMAEAFG